MKDRSKDKSRDYNIIFSHCRVRATKVRHRINQWTKPSYTLSTHQNISLPQIHSPSSRLFSIVCVSHSDENCKLPIYNSLLVYFSQFLPSSITPYLPQSLFKRVANMPPTHNSTRTTEVELDCLGRRICVNTVNNNINT